MNKTRRKQPAKVMTLKEESLAENKELGLEQMQEQMDFIFKVLHEHGINSRLWLQEYTIACEAHGMKAPPDVEQWLPWNLSTEQKKRLSKDCHFEYGQARFVQTNTGKTYHLRKDCSRVEISIGDLTAAEFERLTGLCIS